MIARITMTLIGLMPCLASVAVLGSDARDGLSFGAMPFLPPERMEQEFKGYAEALEIELDQPVSFETRTNFDEYQQAVQQAVFDIVWIPPFEVAMAIEAGYGRLMRTDQDFAAIFVTNLSTVQSIADLVNRKIGMSRPGGATTRLAKMTLTAENLLGKITTYHFPQHQACLEALVAHQVSACVTHPVPVGLFERSRGLTLNVIHETVKIPSSVIAIHERVPAGIQDRIVQVITTLQDQPYGRELLAETGIDSGWIATGPEEYLKLKDLRAIPAPTPGLPIREDY